MARPPSTATAAGSRSPAGRARLRPGDPLVCPWDDEDAAADAAPEAAPERRVSMACLGRGGRWGNTIQSYLYLQAFAHVHGLVPEVPRWIGQDLFGARDAPITRRHPVILYDLVSELRQASRQPLHTFSLAATRARTVQAQQARRLLVVRDPLLAVPAHPLPTSGLDLEGPYFVHTRHLAPFRELLRSRLTPVPALRQPLEAAWRALRARGDTVIGLHVRRGDFDRAFARQGFEFVAPPGWYLAWLAELWRRSPRPVLFVATDSPERVLPAFASFRPVTSGDLPVSLPPGLLRPDLPPVHIQRDATFLPDWFILTRCDALAISNSTFSFTASMLNETARTFARPDPARRALVPYDPWDSEPLLFLPPARNLLLDTVQRLDLTHRPPGPRGLAARARLAVGWYLTVLRLRAMACRHHSGRTGLWRELLRAQFYLAPTRRYDSDPPVPAVPSPCAPVPLPG